MDSLNSPVEFTGDKSQAFKFTGIMLFANESFEMIAFWTWIYTLWNRVLEQLLSHNRNEQSVIIRANSLGLSDYEDVLGWNFQGAHISTFGIQIESFNAQTSDSMDKNLTSNHRLLVITSFSFWYFWLKSFEITGMI